MDRSRPGKESSRAPWNDSASASELLRIRDLTIDFGDGPAVNGVNLDLRPGKIVGVAGQSGSGKSLTALAAMELVGRSEREMSKIRGSGMTMVFQETVTALNPVVHVGRQLSLAVKANVDCDAEERHARVVRSLHDVQLDDADRIMSSYPREVIDIIRKVADERAIAVMLISHDIGVLEEVCDELAVMFNGRVVEHGAAQDVVTSPAHPYTAALLNSVPRIGARTETFVEMPEFAYAVGDHRAASEVTTS